MDDAIVTLAAYSIWLLIAMAVVAVMGWRNGWE